MHGHGHVERYKSAQRWLDPCQWNGYQAMDRQLGSTSYSAHTHLRAPDPSALAESSFSASLVGGFNQSRDTPSASSGFFCLYSRPPDSYCAIVYSVISCDSTFRLSHHRAHQSPNVPADFLGPPPIYVPSSLAVSSACYRTRLNISTPPRTPLNSSHSLLSPTTTRTPFPQSIS